MSRATLLIVMILSVLIALITFAETTWVLWSVKNERIIHSEKGHHAVWAYVDAFTSKQGCIEGKNIQVEQGIRYQCVPVEIDPNKTIFR